MTKWPWIKDDFEENVDEPVQKQLVTEHRNRLTVLWKDGTTTWWEYVGSEKRSNESAWRYFLKWYHGRKSPVFTVSYANSKGNGSLTFKRSDIVRFSLDYTESEKTVDSPDE